MPEAVEARDTFLEIRVGDGAMRPDFVASIQQALATQDAEAARALTR